MEDLNSINKRPHKVTLLGRRTCNLTGVNDVLSFDEREVILETEQGMLMMKGSGLHVTYSEQASMTAKSESLLTRLFK